MFYRLFALISILLGLLAFASARDVAVSGQFKVAAEGEAIQPVSGHVGESPLFNLPSMRVAREYLQRQLEKERAAAAARS